MVTISFLIFEGLTWGFLYPVGILQRPYIIDMKLFIAMGTIIPILEYIFFQKDVLKNDPNINYGLLFTFLTDF